MGTPLNDRVVVVTGASSGVGRATALEFARAGARVALVARGEAGLKGAVVDVENAGNRALAVPADVADASDIERAAETIENELGEIDVWVNNAMTTVFGRLVDMDAAEFRRVTEVTYLGSVHGTMAALARMRPRDRGTIVQVGSALAYRGIPLQTAYCGAKHALQGFMESLRCELLHEHSNVRVTSVHLPGLNTPQFDWCETRMPHKAMPVPPIYQPEVAARAVRWAAEHPQRREVWVGGSTVATILANRVAPGLLDRYLARTNIRAQQRSDPASPDQPANLWNPVDADADYGAHGAFDDRASARSVTFDLTRRRAPLAAAGAIAGALWLSARRGRA